MVASHTPPTGDLALNPGICPDGELNQRSFGSQHSLALTPLSHTSHGSKYNLKINTYKIQSWIFFKKLSSSDIVMFYYPVFTGHVEDSPCSYWFCMPLFLIYPTFVITPFILSFVCQNHKLSTTSFLRQLLP